MAMMVRVSVLTYTEKPWMEGEEQGVFALNQLEVYIQGDHGGRAPGLG